MLTNLQTFLFFFEIKHPTVFGNGTVLMVTRGTSLFRASSWRGPYHLLRLSIIPNEQRKNSDPKSTKTEDAFFWRSPRGFHLLMHDHAPFPYHKQVITYAFTNDQSAIHNWQFSFIEAANGINVPVGDADAVHAAHEAYYHDRSGQPADRREDQDGSQARVSN